MKNTLSFIAILFFVNNIFSQQEAITASAKYLVTVKQNKNRVIEDTCRLDISKTKSFFYSIVEQRKFNNFKKMIEAQIMTGNNKLDIPSIGESKTYPYKFEQEFIHNKVIVIDNVGTQKFGYLLQGKSSPWQLLNDTMTINGFLCNKATKNALDTVSIDVWYCSNLPYVTGPFGCRGLPGMVLKNMLII